MKLWLNGYITGLALFFALLTSGVWYMAFSEGKGVNNLEEVREATLGKHIVVYLDKKELVVKDNETILKTFSIVSLGKPGSYYETVGGVYINDYKLKNHFSSFGYVYMPFSVHVFGNFFIHGIPYFPDGEKVASTYSGGCIRLEDNDAEYVYDFVDPGTKIIITKGDDALSFFQKDKASTPITSIEMTRLMTAVISLEFLNQNDNIKIAYGTTTLLSSIPTFLYGKNDKIGEFYGNKLGKNDFLEYMNKKADAIGLTNTKFSGINTPADTTTADYKKFINHIIKYKSYLYNVSSSTPYFSL